MSSTLNYNMVVNTSSIQSATQQVHQAMNAGMASMGVQMPMGGMSPYSNTRQVIPMMQHPSQYAIQTSNIPFQTMMGPTVSAIQNTMAQVQQMGQNTMMAGMGRVVWQPPRELPRTSAFMANAVNAAASAGSGFVGMKIGEAIGGRFGSIGRFIGGTAGGILGMGLPNAVGFGQMMKRTFYGADYAEPGSKQEAANTAMRMYSMERGARVATLMGFNPGQFESTAAWTKFSAGAMGNLFQNMSRAMGMSEGFTARNLMAMEIMGGRGLRSIHAAIAPHINRVDGTISDAGIAAATAAANKVVHSRGMKWAGYMARRYGMGPEDLLGQQRVVDKFLFGAPKGPGPWTLAGWGIGAKTGLLNAEGVNALTYYSKGQSETDLLLDPRVKRALGGSLGIATRFTESMLASTQVGGLAFGGTALQLKGISPSANILDIAGQFAGAYGGDLGGQINLLGNYHKTTRNRLGGAALVASGRLAAIQQVDLTRKLMGIGNNVSNRTLYTMMLGGGDAAEAQSAMLFGEGKKLVYKGGGYVKLEQTKENIDLLNAAATTAKDKNKALEPMFKPIENGGLINQAMFSSGLREALAGNGAGAKMIGRIMNGQTGGAPASLVRAVKEILRESGGKMNATQIQTALQNATQIEMEAFISKKGTPKALSILQEAGLSTNAADILRQYYNTKDKATQDSILVRLTRDIGGNMDTDKLRNILKGSNAKEMNEFLGSADYSPGVAKGGDGTYKDQGEQLISLMQQQITVMRNIFNYAPRRNAKWL